MKKGNVFKSIIVIIFVLFTLFFFTPFIGITELLYPVRIDSVYVKALEKSYIQRLDKDNQKITPHFYYSPEQLNLKFSEFNVITRDELTLKGWYIPSKANSGITLLIIHDLNESRITLLESARQFNSRGFNVCLMDMRAHGSSEGKKFTLGYMEKYDIKIILDSLYKKYGEKDVVLMGIGFGASLSIEALCLDERPKALIAQSPFNNLLVYAEDYAKRKWGILSNIMLPFIIKELQKQLGHKLEMNVTQSAKAIIIPSLYIAGEKDEIIPFKSTREVHDSTSSSKKEFWLVKEASHYTISELTGEKYYNKISLFILGSLPKKNTKSRFKILA